MNKEELLKVMHFRYACKLFDETKTISDDDLKFILEAGRLSPSSFGLEHWKFLVIRDKPTQKKLQPLCYDQKQISTSSVVIIILAKKEYFLSPGSDYVQAAFRRFDLPPDGYGRLCGFYKKYYSTIDVLEWSISQCFFAAANMMTLAAAVGIDSCPIAAFSAEPIKDFLHIDKEKFEIALIVPFGYSNQKRPLKKRLPLEEVVEFYSP